MTVLERLINNFSKLPGIGKKSASRIVYHLLQSDESYVQQLSREIKELKEVITNCRLCGNYTEIDPCNICSDPHRDKKIICIVEEPRDILSIEAIHDYHGQYHVLMGVISPIEGIGPHQLRLDQLFERIKKDQMSEVIIATNPTIEGETTAQYIVRHLKSLDVMTTRIALGLPVGGALEYADAVTLAQAFKGRNKLI